MKQQTEDSDSEKPLTSYHSCLSESDSAVTTSYHTTLDHHSAGALSLKLRPGFGPRSAISGHSRGSSGTAKLVIGKTSRKASEAAVAESLSVTSEKPKRGLGLLTKAQINRSNLKTLDKGGATPGSESVGGEVSGDESSSVSSPVKPRFQRAHGGHHQDIVKEFSSEDDLSAKDEEAPPKPVSQPPTENSKESQPSYTLQDLVRRTAWYVKIYSGEQEIGVMQHSAIATHLFKQPTPMQTDILDKIIRDQLHFKTVNLSKGPPPAISLRGRRPPGPKKGDASRSERKLSDYCYAEEEKNNNDRQSKVQRLRRYEDRLSEISILSPVPLVYAEKDVHSILNYKSSYYNKSGGAENLFFLEFDVGESQRCGFLSEAAGEFLSSVDQTMVEEGDFTFALNGVLFGENVFAYDLLYKLTGKKLIKSMQKSIEDFQGSFQKELRAQSRGQNARFPLESEEGLAINPFTSLYCRVINVSKNFGFLFHMPKLRYLAGFHSTGFNQMTNAGARVLKYVFQLNLPNYLLDGKHVNYSLDPQKVMMQLLQRGFSRNPSQHSASSPLYHSWSSQLNPSSPYLPPTSFAPSPYAAPHPHPANFSLDQSSPYLPTPIASVGSSGVLPSLNTSFQLSEATAPPSPYLPPQRADQMISSQTLPQSFFTSQPLHGLSTSGGGGIVRAHLQRCSVANAEQESLHSVSSRSTKRGKKKPASRKGDAVVIPAVPVAGSSAAWSPYSQSQTGNVPGGSSFYLNSPPYQSYVQTYGDPRVQAGGEFSENRTLFGDEFAPVEEHDSSLTNLERFLTISTPFMGEQHESMTLAEFWKSFDEGCATGVESVLISENGEALVTYFIPTLSACQISLKPPPPPGLPAWYTPTSKASAAWSPPPPAPSSSSSAKGGMFTFVERAAPHQRKVVSEVVRAEAEKKSGVERRLGLGEDVRVGELDESSWFAILWKFLKMIESGTPVLTSFLVYYQFKPAEVVRFEPFGRGRGKAMGYLPVTGLIGDKLDSRFWLTPSDPVSFEYDEIIKFFVNNEGSELYNQLEEQAVQRGKLLELDHHDLHFILERKASYY